MGRDNEGDIEPLDSIDDRFMPQLEIFHLAGPVRLHASVIGGGARWNDKAWNGERFSVTSSEAASIGVEPFSADASLGKVYLEGAFIYYLSPAYVAEIAVEVAELTGEPADSPLVEELGTTTQPSMFLRINRQF